MIIYFSTDIAESLPVMILVLAQNISFNILTKYDFNKKTELCQQPTDLSTNSEDKYVWFLASKMTFV